MIEVLAYMELIEWYARSMHYRSNSEWFYALHLLADKVDFGDDADDLKEAYYLGFMEHTPPSDKEIVELAMAKFQEPKESDRELIEGLYNACIGGYHAIEQQKKDTVIPGGVHAILDDVSKIMLVVKGLCWRALQNNVKE